MKKFNLLVAMLVALVGGLALPVTEARAWDAPPLVLKLCQYHARPTVCYASSLQVNSHDEVCEIDRIGTRNAVVAGGGMVLYPEANHSEEYGYIMCLNFGHLRSGYSAGFDCCAPGGEYRHSNTRWVRWEEGSDWGIYDEDFVIGGQWLSVLVSTCPGGGYN